MALGFRSDEVQRLITVGLGDVIIGALRADPNGGYSGASYVVVYLARLWREQAGGPWCASLQAGREASGGFADVQHLAAHRLRLSDDALCERRSPRAFSNIQR